MDEHDENQTKVNRETIAGPSDAGWPVGGFEGFPPARSLLQPAGRCQRAGGSDGLTETE
jgi:hypothetical protein